MTNSPERVVSPDAVVVLPGIMGSRLRERSSGKLVWGLDLAWYARAWMFDKPWTRLALDDDERAGRYGRVVADGLLDTGALAPILGGVEPYGNLVRDLHSVVAAPEAICTFAYDWRLPVTHNGGLLANALPTHLERWRGSEAGKQAQEKAGREAKLVVIAHSMGGLVYRAVVGSREHSSATDDVRAVLTLGTPFSGGAKALLPLSSGEGGPFPLPKGRMRRMARTLPGLYDLLPLYRLIEHGSDARTLTAADVVAIGGDRELAEAALASQGALRQVELERDGCPHYTYIGGFQPTPSTASITLGTAEVHNDSFGVDDSGRIICDASGVPKRFARFGDTTVPLNSAQIQGGSRFTIVAQHHGSLAKVSETISQAKAILLSDDVAPPIPLGDSEFGFEAPSLLEPDTDYWVRVSGVEVGQAKCMVEGADDVGVHAESLRLRRRSGEVGVLLSVPKPGVYRLTMETGGRAPVTQLVLAPDPNAEEPE